MDVRVIAISQSIPWLARRATYRLGRRLTTRAGAPDLTVPCRRPHPGRLWSVVDLPETRSLTIPLRCLRWLLCAPLLLGACDREAQPPISDDAFVDVMVALRRAAAEHAGDATGFDAAKHDILADAGVTDSLLFAYVDVRGRDPERLGTVFDEIRDSLRTPVDTVPR